MMAPLELPDFAERASSLFATGANSGFSLAFLIRTSSRLSNLLRAASLGDP